MPKVSVYLPEDLYREARERRLPISALAQQAVEAALRRGETDRWVDAVRARGPRCRAAIDTSSLLGEVRDDFGS